MLNITPTVFPTFQGGDLITNPGWRGEHGIKCSMRGLTIVGQGCIKFLQVIIYSPEGGNWKWQVDNILGNF